MQGSNQVVSADGWCVALLLSRRDALVVVVDLLRVLVTSHVFLHLSGIRFYVMTGEPAETVVCATVMHAPASPLILQIGR